MLRNNHRNSATFKVPNNLILDSNLTYSAKRVGCVLYSRCDCSGNCTMSINQIALLAMCSSTTALKAVQELERFGYVARYKNRRYSAEKGRVVYQKSNYTVTLNNRFTFIPRNVFSFQIKNSSFAVYLFLRMCAGNNTRAFPSLSRICNDLYISKSAVCSSLSELSDAGLVLRLPCKRKGKQEFCNNSYFFIRNAEPKVKKKTLPVIFPYRRARHTQNVQRRTTVRIRRSVCHKLFHVSIIQATSRKINTGG